MNPNIYYQNYGAAGKEEFRQMNNEIGTLVNHSTNTILLAPDYGITLRYFAFLDGTYWPYTYDMEIEGYSGGNPNRSVQQRFEQDYKKLGADYFIITDLGELNNQPGLNAYLNSRFTLVKQTGSYKIYSLR